MWSVLSAVDDERGSVGTGPILVGKPRQIAGLPDNHQVSGPWSEVDGNAEADAVVARVASRTISLQSFSPVPPIRRALGRR